MQLRCPLQGNQEPGYTDEASFGSYIAAESAKWKDIIKDLPRS